MATRSIQLQASFGASFASTSASQIYYSVESFDGTSRIARTNSTVRAAGDGSFFALPSIDDAWLPCIAKWDDGGSSGLGSATRKASGGIDIATILEQLVESGADSDVIAAAVASLLAGSAVNVSSLVVARGVMQLVAGDKYTTDRMQPFTRTGWTGEDLDTKPGKMLFIPLATYNENSNEDVATLVVDGTFSQTGTTVTMNFPMSAAQTLTLNPARSGKGVTEYKVQVRANDPINETVWLGRAEVSRGITE